MTKRMTLKEARCRAALSQAALAFLAELDRGTVLRIEHSKYRPTFFTIRQLSEALGVKPQDIAWPGNPLLLEDEEDAA